MAEEKRFETKVKEFLKKENCWVLKTWSNGIQREGIPDLLICCNGFFLAVELKAEKGTVKELQKWNIREIRKANGIAFPLYPDQFEDFKQVIQMLQYEEHELAFNKQNFFRGMGEVL